MENSKSLTNGNGIGYNHFLGLLTMNSAVSNVYHGEKRGLKTG